MNASSSRLYEDPNRAANPKALILGSTVFSFTATDGSEMSLEEQQAQLAGFDTTVVDDTTWGAMSASDFRAYQVIIIGDPYCGDTVDGAAGDDYVELINGNLLGVLHGGSSTGDVLRQLADSTVRVKTTPCIRTNSGDTCRAAALAHQGIILQPTFLVGDDLAAGRLVELMPEYRSIELGIYAVYPTRKHVPAKVRALIDFLAAHFAQVGGF